MRGKVLARLRNGWSEQQIALHLGISLDSVRFQIHRLCREEGVADVWALARKLRFAKTPPAKRNERARRRRVMVVEMWLANCGYKEMAQKLGVSVRFIEGDVRAIYRVHGVKGRSCVGNRRMLAEKLGVRYVSRGDEVRSMAGELRERGLTWNEVAREIGMTARGVRGHLRKVNKRDGPLGAGSGGGNCKGAIEAPSI